MWEEISDGVDIIELGKRAMPSRAYVAAFNFKGGDQQKKVGQLSGGERNRVHLAKMLKSGANVLLLDEPTNDLDVDTLRALEEALEEFAGCAMVISHDRWFLDRIATHILAFEGDSHVEWFEGNYQDYEADRKRRLGARRRPAAPHQVQAAGADINRAHAGAGSACAGVRLVISARCSHFACSSQNMTHSRFGTIWPPQSVKQAS